MVDKKTINTSLKKSRLNNRRPIIGRSTIETFTLNNFKPFSDKKNNSISIKPITLIYGWNNSGKSSILELLQLISLISESYNNDTLIEFNANNHINLGSYKNYIFENDTSNNLKIAFEIDRVSSFLSFYTNFDFYNRKKENEYGYLIEKLSTSKSKIFFEYCSSEKSSDKANLHSFEIQVEGLINLKASKDENGTFKILDLDLIDNVSDEFFNLLSIHRQNIIANLEDLYEDIYTACIDTKLKGSIGYSIQENVNAISKIIEKNLNILEELFTDGLLPFSFVDYETHLGETFTEIHGVDPMWSDSHKENESIHFYLSSIYEATQYTDLQKASTLISFHLNNADDSNTQSYIKNVEKLMNYLNWPLLEDEDYVALIDAHFNRKKKLNKSFWEKFASYLPNELKEGFVTEGMIHENLSSKGKTKISSSKLKFNRNIVQKFLEIEAEFINRRVPIVYEYIEDVRNASMRLKGKSSLEHNLAGLSDIEDKVPFVNISVNEYEDILSNLKSWDGKKGKRLDKIKKIFFDSFNKSLIFKTKENKSGAAPLESLNCITLSSFLIGYIEKANEKISKNEFYQIINNFSSILNSVIGSIRNSIRTRTFRYPTEKPKRFYEKRDLNESFRPISFKDDFSYENVFNILINNPSLCGKVNENLKKMGFDFEINFEVLKGKHNEEIFYTLAKNLNNKEINTNIADMGLGLKRIIPLITYLFSRRTPGIICIEEPEANLHPKYQSEIAELLVDSFNKQRNTHIVETHSEILILRILKLIKQKKIKPKDISVNFIQKNKGESSITNIGINENGEFTSRWPEGFFKERLNEIL